MRVYFFIVKLIVIVFFCSCSEKGGIETSPSNSVTKGTSYVPLEDRRPIEVTGQEVLKFWNGPCFKLEDLRALNPHSINVNFSTHEKPINLSTVSPILFVDEISEDSIRLGENTPVQLIQFDSYPYGKTFVRLPESIKKRSKSWGGRWSQITAIQSPVSKISITAWDRDRWKNSLESEYSYEYPYSGQKPSDPMKFYGNRILNETGTHSFTLMGGLDSKNLRRVRFGNNQTLREFVKSGGHLSDLEDTETIGAELKQVFQDETLHSKFYISLAEIQNTTNIFDRFNAIIESAIVPCETSN